MALFKRGYRELNERLERRSRYTMSCYNCNYFYKTDEDEEEVCQNPRVLKYDMVVTDNNIFCNLWERSGKSVEQKPEKPPSVKSIFKRRNRE